jgi:hypothetical protein
MTKEQESLKGHISDMMAVTEHILEAVRRQLEDNDVKSSPQTQSLLSRVEQTLQMQVTSLRTQLERFGTVSTNPIKEAFSQVTGAMAGLYDKVRPQTVSRMLRDDYTAMSLAVVANSMLHTTALCVNDSDCAQVAQNNMSQLASLIIQLGEAVLPEVERELAAEHRVQPGASQTALANVRRIWSSDAVRLT